jgi:hypothetical protein
MTSGLDRSGRSAGDKARNRAYHRDFWPSIVAYTLVLTAVVHWGDLDGPSPWRYVWALLPVIPLAWTVRAVVRHARRVDDHQRELLLQGLGVGFGVAMIAAVTVGFLSIAGLALPFAGWVIYGVGMMGWATGTGFAHHRG